MSEPDGFACLSKLVLHRTRQAAVLGLNAGLSSRNCPVQIQSKQPTCSVRVYFRISRVLLLPRVCEYKRLSFTKNLADLSEVLGEVYSTKPGIEDNMDPSRPSRRGETWERLPPVCIFKHRGCLVCCQGFCNSCFLDRESEETSNDPIRIGAAIRRRKSPVGISEHEKAVQLVVGDCGVVKL